MKERQQSLDASWLMPPYGSKQSLMKKIEVQPAIQINRAHVRSRFESKVRPLCEDG